MSSAKPVLLKGEVEMYAIAFDLDAEMLKNTALPIFDVEIYPVSEVPILGVNV